MTLNLIVRLTLGFAVAFGVAACSSSASAPTTAPTSPPGSTSISAPTTSSDTVPAATAASNTELARIDSQGAVEFVVTPLNLWSPGETLDFDVSMSTHSVDLSWELAVLSTLKTDNGQEVMGLSWPVGSGHHYEGTLTFPAKTTDGKILLEGAKTLTLTIGNTDVAARVFVWELAR